VDQRLEATAIMKQLIVAGVFVLTNVVGPAMAQTPCSPFGGFMTGNGIQSLLNPGTNVYACYNPGTRENNETLLTGTTSGSFQEYHKGGATIQNEGMYTISGGASTGTIQYAYTGGKSYTYDICLNPSGNTYQFVNTSTNALLSIVVTTSLTGGSC
jgi:hypothetical protein